MASKTESSTTKLVLTLDVSAKCVGYCFGELASEKIIKYGKYVEKDDDSAGRGEKLFRFGQWLAKTINSLPYKPSHIVIEAPYYSKNIKTYGVLSKYVAIAERETYRLTRITAEFIAPSAVKSALEVPSGKTHAERKYNMVKKINSLLGMELNFHKKNKNISDDDIADAIGLFLTYCARYDAATS